jgi:hypothetical protein
MKVTIEETLAAGDVDTALTNAPYLIYSEVLEGARRPLVFLEVCQENFDLIGATGNSIQFLKASQLSATESTEATILASGMAASDKSLSAVQVSVTTAIWSAVQLSDWLKEDYPRIDMLRIHLRNMGKAVMEKLDANVYTVLNGASGVVTHSCAAIDEGELADALAKMENGNWIASVTVTPYLIVAPEAAAKMLKDTTFVTTERYTTYELSRIVQGELGKYVGLRVLKTSYLDGKTSAFIVFPNDTANGPVVVLCWKRRLKVVNEYEATKSYTYFNTSIRAKAVVVQAEGICKITQTTTP